MALINASIIEKVTKSIAKVLEREREEISVDGISKTFEYVHVLRKKFSQKIYKHDTPFLFVEAECLKKNSDEEENKKIL